MKASWTLCVPRAGFGDTAFFMEVENVVFHRTAASPAQLGQVYRASALYPVLVLTIAALLTRRPAH